MLRYGNLIEGVAWLAVVVGGEFEQAALTYGVVPFVQFGEEIFHLVSRHIGKETQAPRVDAHDGDACSTYATGGLEEGAVAAEADGHVDAETAEVVNDAGGLEGKGLCLAEEAVEVTVYIYLVAVAGEDGKQLLGMCRLAGLIDVSE